MPSISGSFSGKIKKQFGISPKDQANHDLSIAEVNGIQKSPDALWDNSEITYWGITDLLDGKGSQTGYFDNIHRDQGRDWGTFEGRVTTTPAGLIVEGKYTFIGGDSTYEGLTGGGTFKILAKSETEVEATWTGSYELAKAQSNKS